MKINPASPELIAAIANATAIYNTNKEKVAQFAKELEESSGYLAARDEVKRLHDIHLAQK